MRPVSTLVGGREIVAIDGSVSTLEAARLMATREIGALPVIEGDRLMGIVSERDVLARVVAANRDPATTPVGDIMSAELVVADAAESCDQCLQRMQQAHIRHLIVLDHGRFAGIVSFRDLLTQDVDEKAEAISLLNAYVVV
jgi:CBS domain-containing protein